ncbi:amino acid ABC transporter permease [Futiania mangrovi]|uniref:Amino acid ABC transporter permease n=1 Tax=Futiania mangrovi TaxID=2959716 RepID=A0A9J6PKG2_9PROT|nr:amino acid ABC transporter permease [Futiania mangrovii]MCP1337055.1 amino acid ABC transporter permease [Futiania mangrovii]
MDVELIVKVLPFFAQAAWVTVQLSVLALLLALACGAAGAALKLSRLAPLRWIGTAYVSVFRGTPALIQLFVWYFGGPQVGIRLEPFEAGVIGIGVNIGAYMTESIRGAILAVDKGQVEAARSLGLSRFQTLRKVTLPEAARLMIRPLGVNSVALIKGTALVSAISVVELTYTAHRFIGSTYRPFEMLMLSGAFYILIVYALIAVIERLDRRYAFD